MAETITKEIFLGLVGENIKKFRFRKGWSQEKLGIEVGLTRMHINRIENGYNITLTTILKLSLALDVKPESIIKVKLEEDEDTLEGLVDTSKANRSKKDAPNKKPSPKREG